MIEGEQVWKGTVDKLKHDDTQGPRVGERRHALDYKAPHVHDFGTHVQGTSWCVRQAVIHVTVALEVTQQHLVNVFRLIGPAVQGLASPRQSRLCLHAQGAKIGTDSTWRRVLKVNQDVVWLQIRVGAMELFEEVVEPTRNVSDHRQARSTVKHVPMCLKCVSQVATLDELQDQKASFIVADSPAETVHTVDVLTHEQEIDLIPELAHGQGICQRQSIQ